MSRRRSFLVSVSAVALVAGLTSLIHENSNASATPTAVSDATTVSAPIRRPNVILVTADDATTYDLRWMPKTRHLLGDYGRTYTQALSPHPLCCPARAELLTGQYAQNNGVQHNEGEYGGFPRLDPRSTIATWLHRAGYRTAFHGKYLNGYGVADARQPGWDEWDPLIQGIYSYTSFKLWNNDPNSFKSYTDDYVTDVLQQRTNASIRRFASQDRPFFIWTSHVAPHGSVRKGGGAQPPIPAPRHRGLFADVEPPSFSKPSFNEDQIDDQPREYRLRSKLKKDNVRWWFRQRIRSEQAIDEASASLVRTLRDVGELRNTWIFFTSDNGFSEGEHRYLGKNFLNGEITAVPLLVRGPGVRGGTHSALPVSTPDLPVTFSRIAQVDPRLVVDGQAFLDDAQGRTQSWRDTQLIQTGSTVTTGPHPGWAFRGVRTARYVYAVDTRNGERLLYDHRRDPYELRNVASWPAYARVVRELERRAALLGYCAGPECRRTFGPVPAPDL